MSLLLLFNQPPYYRLLLDTARQLLQQNHREIVLVTAQMACENYTEQIFVAAYHKKGIAYLEQPIDDLVPSYNLANEKVRSLYVALTGDRIHDQPFWPKYKELVTLRNKVMHSGARVSKDQAEEACKVADQLVTHLTAIIQAV